MKVCNTCGDSKELIEYAVRRRSPDGLAYTCRTCQSATAKRWYKDNKELTKERARVWHSCNQESSARSKSAWREANPAAMSEARSNWRSSNKHKTNSYNAKRRAKVKYGCSEMPDSEKEQVEHLYWLAKDLKAVSGEDYHVDHIIPLSKGGEHRLHNLQILHAEDNLRKGAKLP